MTTDRVSLVVAAPVIAAVCAHTAAATPGVVRLEPGLRGLASAAWRAGRQRWSDTDPAPGHGVRVRRSDTRLRVWVDITISATARATDVGCAVQRAIVRSVLENTGDHVDEVSVCVLDIAPEPP
ncbi:Asp23/Gls24 family envelope stress response protein [Nocardia sp. NBC_01329]|uniref:Asp23/Gls24 family envelope stress response protein n=1 Tax=Nocardia sp. NBC_01329 TaxID=2903594 RepID=UPI002E10A9C3|nr:Asp23/Gls24 family envelope stress response protein [Nocardia sp. NBC_01329]